MAGRGLKDSKDVLWGPIPNTLKSKGVKDMDANEILGKETSMRVGVGMERTESGNDMKKGPAYVHPTTEVDVKSKGMGKAKAEHAGAYAGEMGGSAKGSKEKMSPMAQEKNGAPDRSKPRKGY